LGVKFFSFFVIFFALCSVFLFYQKSKTLIVKHKNSSTPTMVFKDVTSYNITYDGIDSVLKAKVAKKFRNKDEFYKIYTTRIDEGTKEYLWADKGVWKRKVLQLFGNVLYKDDLNRSLSSDTVTYNVKKDILSSRTPFVSQYNSSTLKGSSFVYYIKLKRLYAKNIKAKIRLEK